MTKKVFAAEIEALSIVLSAIEALDDVQRAWVLQTAASRLNLRTPQEPTVASAAVNTIAHGETLSDPRQFIRSKNPQTDVQRVACLAYFITNYRDQRHFKARDLSALNTEAAGPRMNMSRAINNATTQSRYLAAAGGGNKQLSPLGEDVVNALPDQEAVKNAEQSAGARRKRSGRKRRTAKAKR